MSGQATKESMIEKMKLESQDIAARNREELKRIFPSVFTETKNEKGDLVESIDFEKLRSVLSEFSDVFESRRERYAMEWPGKRDCTKLIQKQSIGSLQPDRDASIEFDNTSNVFIEGDNLEVLKLLQKSYYSKVKLIYIDPPYNTGKEFIYPDNYAENLATYLAYAGLVDDEGRKFSTNTETDGRRHSKWLNMMYPRIYLARNLLTDDGVMFISIDENEVSNLRRVCDEIFGTDSFLGTIVWKNATDNNPSHVVVEHEYVLAYCKSKAALEPAWKSHVSDVKTKLLEVEKEFINEFSDVEERQAAYTSWFREHKSQLWPLDRYKFIDDGGIYIGSQSVHNPGREGYRYDVIHPVTKKPCKQPLMGYRFPPETMDRMLEEGKILFGDDHDKIIEIKVYASEFKDKLSSVFELDGRLGAYDLNKCFPEMKRPFTNPKPVRLLTYFMPFILRDEGDLVLDFFAGSCSTGEAVYRLNRTDGIRRNFILVQLPEPCGEETEAFKAGFETISALGVERIRRSIALFHEEEGNNLFSQDNEEDLGFRIFRLRESCFRIWQKAADLSDEQIVEQLELSIDHVDPDASEEDILFELLLKAGQRLSQKIETKTLSEKRVYSIEDDSVLICLENEITQGVLDEIVELDPIQFICLDSAFSGNDQLKANAVQTFSAHNAGRDKADQVMFRTV